MFPSEDGLSISKQGEVMSCGPSSPADIYLTQISARPYLLPANCSSGRDCHKMNSCY